MKIIASSIQRGLDTFLHAGYLSAAAEANPPPSPEYLAAVKSVSSGEILSSFTASDLMLLAAAAGLVVAVVLGVWYRARRTQRRLQADLEAALPTAMASTGHPFNLPVSE